MIKCYHARRVELVVDSEPQLFFQGQLTAPLIATIESDKEDLEDVWDCCNNSCWWGRRDFRRMRNYKDKFKVKFTEKYGGFCNDDLIVEMGGVFHVAKSCGWTRFKTFSAALHYCEEHSHWCQLHEKNRQHPTGKEHTEEELNAISKEYQDKGFKTYLYRK